MTIDEAAAQAFIFFLAGFETTSTTTSFALFEMAFNQEIQQKAREEVLLVLSNYSENITYDGLMEMKYLDTVVNGNHNSINLCIGFYMYKPFNKLEK